MEVQVLRIVQEALSNVRRHAKASSVDVTFDMSDGTLLLTVEDNGDGFDPSSLGRGEWPRFGLQAMRERAESVGGTLSIESASGQGTVVRARFPGAASRPIASYR
jgi:signal transduction histidine kinase